MKQSETKKVSGKREITPETAKKALKTPIAPVSPKSAPVVKRQKETKDKIDETLLPMKTGLKFVVSQYIKTLNIPAEKLEETIRLTLENLSEQADANGRKLDSLYWFMEGCSVEIKKGKIFAKNPEGNILVDGVKIKVIKPKKTAKAKAIQTPTPEKAVVDSEPVAEPAPDISNGEAPDEAIPTQEEEFGGDDVTSIDDDVTPDTEAEAPAPPVEPGHATTSVAEQAPTQLTPELIALLTKTNVEFQGFRVEFDSLKSKPAGIEYYDLEQRVAILGNTLAKLPDSQFQLPQTRLVRTRIATLTVEIESVISAAQQPDRKAVEIPSLITGLKAKVGAFSENAATWISEVDLITNTSRVPTEKEVQSALDKNTQLLSEFDGLRKTISDIETSPAFDGALRPQINTLKEQIAVISKSIEKPVEKLQVFLANHKKPLSAPPPTRFSLKDNGGVVNLRTVTTGNRNLPVNVDDVLSGRSLTDRVLDWFRNLTR